MSGIENHESSELTGMEIAVIGMTARFPGAKHIDEFWNNLVQGVESISFFSREEMLECGIALEDLDHPNYVAAKAFLEDVEYFDAAFFGYSVREGEIMSPQTRLSLECAWEVLEDAGYDPDAYDGAIGAFVGASHGGYWEALSFTSGKNENFGELSTILLNDKDFVGAYISYKLNLKGPGFTLFTACSTSGVAIHQACQSLLSGDCQMVLAGGVSVWLPRKRGYIYQEGTIFSKDGHSRPFEARSTGTIFGDGIGMVILKLLEDAITDRDHIYAVIKGTAINNDGNQKMGFAAPSTEGQAAVIRAAFHVAGVEPESISYVEAHGTGTPIGDPIEVEALKLAFNTDKTGFCKIGSVKGNVGQLDTASGFAGFIKTVLALNHRLIPPTLHCEKTNPKIDFETGPFRINTELTDWNKWKKEDYPLRAGVSFYGVGGTNVHAILEEWPDDRRQKTEDRRQIHDTEGTGGLAPLLFLLSAKTPTALDRMTENLANYLKKNPGLTLADAAYTLQVGRKAFQYRRMLVGTEVDEVAAALSSPEAENVHSFKVEKPQNTIIFMFPGQGSQHVNMGLDLYKTEPIFREEMNRCFEILRPLIGYDIKEILYPHSDCRGGSPCPPQDCLGTPGQGDHRGSPLQSVSNSDHITHTEIAQLMVFMVEYALAKLLMSWGIKPDIMIGHSIGEYAAAHFAGVLSLEDALKLVVLRGKLIQRMPSGAMLVVQLSEEALNPLLNDQLALAAINSPSTCEVSGSHEAVEALKEKLTEKGIKSTLFHTPHAFHSPTIDPIIEEFAGEVKKVTLNPPQIPYISNTTGTFITDDQVINSRYWSNHLRKTVRFTAGVKELLKEEDPIFVEVGPGNALGILVKKIWGSRNKTSDLQPIVNLMRHPRENCHDVRYLLNQLGRLWLLGVPILWKSFYSGESRYRMPLPSYPFAGQYYWIQGNPYKIPGARRTLEPKKKPDLSDWFYIPLWKQSVSNSPESKGITGKSCWMVMTQEKGLAFRLEKQLQVEEHEVIAVRTGARFVKESDRLYTINPGRKTDYEALFKELCDAGRVPDHIIHLWGLDSKGNEAQDKGFYSLVYLAQALGKTDLHHHVHIIVVTDGLHDINGEEALSPEKAMVLAPVININQEFTGISCRCIDILLPRPGDAGEKEEKLVRQLLREFKKESPHLLLAYRNDHRWERTFEPVKLVKSKEKQEAALLRNNGVYLITGGLGNIGFLLAKELFRRVGAKLVLTGRSQLPPEPQWQKWLSAHEKNDPINERINKVLELRELGAEVLVFQADTADRQQMERIIKISEEQWGSINGVIHAAGIVGEKAFRPLDQLRKTDCQEQFQAKVKGLLTLQSIFRHKPLDFCILMSSIASQLGGLGLTAYSAANIFMDTFAVQHKKQRGGPWMSVNWDIWESEREISGRKKELFNGVLGQLSITPEQGINVFSRILAEGVEEGRPQLVVSTGDLLARIDRWAKAKPVRHRAKKKELLTTYVAPRNQVESIIAGVVQEYLGIEQVGIYDSFFDLGAKSLDLSQINAKLNGALGKEVSLVHLLTYPSIAAFANYYIEEVLGDKEENKNEVKEIRGSDAHEKEASNPSRSGQEIAVIGMTGRFPGADHIEEFWWNLKKGIESIAFFSEEELIEAGLSRELLENPDYIKAKGIITGVEYFDALFFDYSPREAEMMDPQVRLFHQCVWEVLEKAGYEPTSCTSPIGLYVGTSSHYYWDALYTYRQTGRPSDQFGTVHFYDKDFMGTRISHKLNLKGPAFTLSTACSGSLVAIHLACQSLLNGENEMALAGGVSVWLPEKLGYLYEEGMILSADGHLRTFDEKATGSVLSDGVGVVLLKPLKQALMDGDSIHAVVKGTAINNDGNRKLAYTAPSVEGQAEVIAAAIKAAAVEAESITYIEAHGTATNLGDVVEIEALKRVFANVKKKQSCAIGTVKTNVGHLNSAAGAAGFIKTVLALKHRQIPPSLYFDTSNPKIDFENSPFYVITQLEEWKSSGYMLRAGVSSFGIGGTNAHAILEEPPPIAASSPGREWNLLMLSARTKASIDQAKKNMAQFFKENPDINPWDAAYTLQVGRKSFEHRKMVIGSTVDDVVEALSTPGLGKLFSGKAKNQGPAVIFMFPGQGSQYTNMGLGLYQGERVFREELDRCLEILKTLTGYDIKEFLYPDLATKTPGQQENSIDSDPEGTRGLAPLPLESAATSEKINHTEIGQPLIFMFEYALAKLLNSWGIRPDVMIGYSFGEYAAACISGVFSLEDALRLVVLRGRLMQRLPEGAMLSVPLTREKLKPLLENQPSLAIAIDNGPSCVVSGNCEAIESFEKRMREKKYLCIRVGLSQAFHSAVMGPVLSEFEREVREMTLKEPQIPYISNVTGKTVEPGEVTNPIYWVKHLKDTVLFSDGINQLLKIPHPIFLEVGPGRDLSVLLRSHKDYDSSWRILNLVRHEKEEAADLYHLLNRIGHLWLYGVEIDWCGFYADEKRHRIPLPTYNFEARYFPIDRLPMDIAVGKQAIQPPQNRRGINDWFYRTVWKRSRIPITAETFAQSGGMLLFIDQYGLGRKIEVRLKQLGFQVFVVQMGDRFARVDQEEYMVNPVEIGDYEALFDELYTSGHLAAISMVLHLWNITPVAHFAEGNGRPGIDRAEVEKELDRGFYSLIAMTQALARQKVNYDIQVKVVTNNVQDVIAGEAMCPGKATLVGPVNVIEREFPGIRCCMIDLILPKPGSQQEQKLVNRLVQEFKIKIRDKERMITYRNGYRWVREIEPLEMEKNVTPRKGWAGLREGGVYLVTGGVGGIGLILARHLAESVKAKLILTGRSAFPEREHWDEWLSTHDPGEKVSTRIGKIRELEARGAEVLVFSADAADFQQMQQVIPQGEQIFGKLNGVIHAAGLPDGAMIPLRNREISQRVLAPKVFGTLVLAQLLKDADLDFWVFCSSIASILSFPGQTAYVAANAFLDAFAVSQRLNNGIAPISINWDRWQGVGFAVIAEQEHEILMGNNIGEGITSSEGIEAFNRILADPLAGVIVSPYDLKYRINQLNMFDVSSFTDTLEQTKSTKSIHERPELSIEYTGPTNDIERKLTSVWEEYLGLQQVGIHDNFFELGATSLDVIQVNNRLNTLLGTKIPLVKLLTYTTVNSFANYYMEEVIGEKVLTGRANRSEAIQRGKKKLQRKYKKRRAKELDV